MDTHIDRRHAVTVPGHDVRRGVSLRVANMQAGARRIREHVQHELLRPALRPLGRLERVFLLPVLLPARLYRLVVVQF